MTKNRRVAIFAGLTICVLSGQSTAVEVREYLNIPYLENANYAEQKDKLDMYVPSGEGPFPVLYFIHGGGLLRGDKSSYGYIGKYFASKGIITVNVNHRLSPGVSHPKHIEDIAASFAWVKKNISVYRGNPSQIVVVGHSAGAYLAGLLALDEKYLKAQGLSQSDIAAVIPISGFFHVKRLAPGRPKTVWGENETDWLAASPAKYATSSAPPTLLLYADADTPERKKESEDLAVLLRDVSRKHIGAEEISDRTHVTIVQQMGKDEDRTSQAVLRFMGTLGLIERARGRRRR
jgi:acetyl esterase/lipase